MPLHVSLIYATDDFEIQLTFPRDFPGEDLLFFLKRRPLLVLVVSTIVYSARCNLHH